MKKRVLKIGLPLLVLIAVIGGVVFAYAWPRYKLSEQQAQAIALKHAGLTASDVTFSSTKKDRDNFKATYEIEFYTADSEYDYTIDATDGSVLGYDLEKKQTSTSSSASTSSSSAPSSETTSGDTDQEITAEQAKAIALADAGLDESAVINLKVEKDFEHGVSYYEVDFDDPAAGLEYDYAIDSVSGDILERSQDTLID
ncbi:hypothetical protein DDV21_008285 [Streptococcus chenjunshii]|uniref:PepSY domain-containing protein n=1 Tax=Streptococcus chenjunshii TaxID=2173853 RepID=A0A372KJ57_9STRE|nr:PepSY domain-containing protein [Streptococcus chenjunshii]AXQ79084.1 hypothetical protein DDV21_008285 [Streptococcus chenjunshii]RFU51280.1 hypothetical protein DDV22_04545 [Streptococcus chenjunshii]RFU52332.1 hypothetical protein DDV23_10210 [Streptococcus chenjunshii]